MWEIYAEQGLAELALIERGPWLLLMYVGFFSLFSLSLIRKMRTKKHGYFLKPWQLVYNGLFFGVYGMACFLILALANGVSNMFTCDQDAALRDDIRPKVYPYAIFLYMLLKIFTSMDIIFHILTKNEQHVTFGRLASAIVDPAIAYYAMSFYPTGIIYFPFLMDSMVGTINYGLGVRSCADDQTGMIPNWEAKVHNLRMIQYMIALVHSIYSLNNDACECSNSFRYVLLAAHLVLSTSYLAKWTLSGKLTEPSSQPRVRSQHSLKAK